MGHAVQHDFRSPIQGIQWSLDLALKGIEQSGCDEKARAQVEKAVSMARKELARLERTSRTLLVEAGVVDEDTEDFDLVELTRDAARHFVTEAAMREVQLTVNAPSEAIGVCGPRAEIAQAMLTCLVRTLDAVPAGGAAEIVLRREGNDVLVEILDSGSDDPASEADEYSIAALGMRMARETVEARGGQIHSGHHAETRRRSICIRLPRHKP